MGEDLQRQPARERLVMSAEASTAAAWLKILCFSSALYLRKHAEESWTTKPQA